MRPSLEQLSTQLGVALKCLSIALKSTSILAKRAASSGSSFFTSSEPMKSVSRYAHLRCVSYIWR